MAQDSVHQHRVQYGGIGILTDILVGPAKPLKSISK